MGKNGLASKSGSSKKSAKKRAVSEKSVSSKTPQVMRLVEQKTEVSPAALGGKGYVPKQLRGREPLSRIMRRDNAPLRAENGDDVEVVNIAELAIKLEAPEILDRFNACSCSKCVAIFSELVSQRVSPRFARVSKSKSLNSAPHINELYGRVEQMRKVVMPEMVKEIMGKKKRWFHDE